MMTINCPRASDAKKGRETKPAPLGLVLYSKKWLPTSWSFLEIEALTDPESVTLSTQHFVTHWIMETAPHSLGTATGASLRQGEVRSGPVGVFHLHEGVAPPLISSLPDVRVLEEVIPPSSTLAAWGAPWDSLSEQEWEFMGYMKALLSNDAAQWDVSAFHPLARMFVAKDRT